MAWKDSQRRLDLEEQNDIYASPSASGNAGRGVFAYALVGIAILVLSGVILYWLLGRSMEEDSMRLRALQGRVIELEQRIDALEGENSRLAELSKQNQRVELYMRRFEKLETDVARRMDHMSDRIDSLKTSPPPPKPAPAPKAAAPSTAPTIHVVAKGETLYSISRKYGMSVSELLQRNQLPANAVIQPGQQLSVGGMTP